MIVKVRKGRGWKYFGPVNGVEVQRLVDLGSADDPVAREILFGDPSSCIDHEHKKLTDNSESEKILTLSYTDGHMPAPVFFDGEAYLLTDSGETVNRL